jgi:carboxyl-terminal processing protease
MQANDRAVLMGETTYGKNTIQLVFQLQDGSSLHVTSAHWWFPELEFPVDGSGLKPMVLGTNDEDWVRVAVDFLLQTP